ncbi:ATP-binding cassette domain-containing protein [Mahella sp.]|uniref:ABC transporter ATP-binding protein n=1 Tax=Mahella sp. TaxID=2798721 RepID=UPI0025BC15D4|nr:ATP-binding cassette domain-containing protein [Mahella sp.]MBZ4665406.1 ATP-binding cassette protein [Mahella sp.]MDK2902664.1 energy-coupling factor transport system ATP-binding protein [Clostridiales bacterium]
MSESIIRIEGLSFVYPANERPSLDNIDLEINKGDFVSIIGGNGSGKTTLCKCINGIIPHFIAGDFYGEVKVCGVDTLDMPVSTLAQRVSYIYQDFESQLVRPTVLDDVTFGPLNFGMKDYHQKGMEALRMLDIEGLKDRFIWELSGGQKHLTALAGALSVKPDIIIIDEPAAQLDPYNAVAIYRRLKILNESFGITVITIEHNTELIAEYCNSVILMDAGRAVWIKPVRDALNAVNDLVKRNIYPPQVSQAAWRISPNMPSYPLTVGEAEKYFAAARIQCPVESNDCGLGDDAHMPHPAIEFKDVSLWFRSLTETTKNVLKDISLSINEGENVAIVGNNGAGKSTLLKMITGVIKPKGGHITVYGTETAEIMPEELSSTVAYIYQNPEEMFIEDSIRKDISYFLKTRHKAHEYEVLDYFINDIIKSFGLEDLQHKDGRMLSGGQQRRASLAIGVAMQPKILLLDEPTGSLDIESRREMVNSLELLKDRVKTVIIATHDMSLAAEWADRVIVMKDGRIIADGDTRSIFDDITLLDQCHLKPPQIVELSKRLNMRPIALSIDEFTSRISSIDEVMI